MPRYFFDFFDDAAAHDEEGVELKDAAAARALAIKYAKELAAEDAPHGKVNLKSFIRVRDESCWALFEVRFADVLNVED